MISNQSHWISNWQQKEIMIMYQPVLFNISNQLTVRSHKRGRISKKQEECVWQTNNYQNLTSDSLNNLTKATCIFISNTCEKMINSVVKETTMFALSVLYHHLSTELIWNRSKYICVWIMLIIGDFRLI